MHPTTRKIIEDLFDEIFEAVTEYMKTCFGKRLNPLVVLYVMNSETNSYEINAMRPDQTDMVFPFIQEKAAIMQADGIMSVLVTSICSLDEKRHEMPETEADCILFKLETNFDLWTVAYRFIVDSGQFDWTGDVSRIHSPPPMNGVFRNLLPPIAVGVVGKA